MSDARLLIFSSFEDRHNALDQLERTLVKMEVEDWVLMAAFNQSEEYSGSVRMAQVREEPWMKSSSHNYS